MDVRVRILQREAKGGCQTVKKGGFRGSKGFEFVSLGRGGGGGGARGVVSFFLLSVNKMDICSVTSSRHLRDTSILEVNHHVVGETEYLTPVSVLRLPSRAWVLLTGRCLFASSNAGQVTTVPSKQTHVPMDVIT